MAARTPQDDQVEAICAALAPYPWRRFTPAQFARTALAARDRHGLETLLLAVEGAELGTWDALEPAAPHDVRVGRLVEFLACHRWTELRLPALCRSLIGVLGD